MPMPSILVEDEDEIFKPAQEGVALRRGGGSRHPGLLEELKSWRNVAPHRGGGIVFERPEAPFPRLWGPRSRPPFHARECTSAAPPFDRC